MRIVFNLVSAISAVSAITVLLLSELTIESAFTILVGLLGAVAWALVAQMWQKIEILERKLAHLEKLKAQA